MSAIEQCRSAALGGYVLCCEGCGANQISYNSCRNRHCPKCQSAAAQRRLDARQTDLLPVEYYHVVFTLPAPITDIAHQNKAALYGLLFDLAAEVLLTIAADVAITTIPIPPAPPTPAVLCSAASSLEACATPALGSSSTSRCASLRAGIPQP